VADCLARIEQSNEVRYRDDCLIPLAQALDIYSVRARINAKRGGKVEGYSELLAALEAAAIPSVRLHLLEFLSHWYIAFTDEPATHLLGVLKSPKTEAAWYDPAKGYEG